MTANRRIAFGTLAYWFSKIITILLGMILLPLLLGNLSKEEVGIWLLLGQNWALLGLLDFGFGVVLTRKIAQAKGKSGSSPDVELNEQSITEIKELIAYGRKVYRWLSLITFFISWSLGFVYLHQLDMHPGSQVAAWLAWSIICISQAITVWSNTWICLLTGTGHVGWDALISSVTNTATLTLQILLVLLGHGIITMAVIATVSAIIQRFLFIKVCKTKCGLFFRNNTATSNPELLREMVKPAFQAWLTSLGGALIANSDSFFIATSTSLSEIPAYRGAYILMLNVYVLASTLPTSSVVFISQMWQAGDKEQAQFIILRNLKIGLLMCSFAGIIILHSGESLFNLWLGPSNYIGPVVILLFVLYFVIEQQNNAILSSCRAVNREEFSYFIVASGIIKISLAFPLLKHLGLKGLAASGLIGQMITTGYAFTYGLSHLELPFKKYLRESVLPCLIFIAIGITTSQAASRLLQHGSDAAIFLSQIVLAGSLLMLSLWMLGLTSEQRTRLINFVKGKTKALIFT